MIPFNFLSSPSHPKLSPFFWLPHVFHACHNNLNSAHQSVKATPCRGFIQAKAGHVPSNPFSNSKLRPPLKTRRTRIPFCHTTLHICMHAVPDSSVWKMTCIASWERVVPRDAHLICSTNCPCEKTPSQRDTRTIHPWVGYQLGRPHNFWVLGKHIRDLFAEFVS